MKRTSTKTPIKVAPAPQKTRQELLALRAMVLRMKREQAALKQEVATVRAEVGSAFRSIDASFDEHDLRVMQEVQEGVAAYYRKSSTTEK